MQNTDRIWDIVEGRRSAYAAFSDRVFDMPEIAYTEYRSSDEHAAMLAAEGFRVTRDVAGIPTALIGEAGDEGPVIAILGEYDALPELGQEAGLAEPQPADGKPGPGHGCGHNLFGAAAMLAAAALKRLSGRERHQGAGALLRLPGRRGRRGQDLHGARRRFSTTWMPRSPGTPVRSMRSRKRASLANSADRLYLPRPRRPCRRRRRNWGARGSTRSS